MNYRRGCHPPDPRLLAQAPTLSSHHRFSAMAPATSVDRSSVDYQPILYGNDDYPNCTAVSIANYARGIACLNGYGIVVEDDAPLTFYAKCVGIDPLDKPALIASEGALFMSAVAEQLQSGYTVGPQMLVGNWATVPVNRQKIALAVEKFGGCLVGANLTDTDEQLPPVWDAPGTFVGCHAMNVWDYDGLGNTDTVRLGTWGNLQRATWSWIEARVLECYVILWRQLERADGTTLGVNEEMLAAEAANMQLILSA